MKWRHPAAPATSVSGDSVQRFIGIVLCLLGACNPGPTGSFESVDGQSQAFDAAGTAVAWIDQVDANLVSRESASLRLFLTGLSFDPDDDLLTLSGSKLADLQLRFATTDAVGFSLINASRRGEATTVELATAPNAATCPDINSLVTQDLTCLRVSPPPLEADTSFDAVRPLGRGATVTLELSAGARETGQAISGTISVAVEAVTGDDAAKVLTGTVSGRFSTTLVGERLAERNLALLGGTGP